MGNEDGLGRDVVARHTAPRLRLGDDPFHHRGDVVDVEAGAVEGAVGRDRPEHLADGVDAAVARGRGRLDHQRRGAHAEDHPVASLVERQRRLLHDLVGGRGTRGQEPGADPPEQVIRGGVVGRDDHDTTAPAGPDPVLGQGDRLGGAGTGGIHLGVGAACPHQLGELRVAHRQDAEQEPAVEGVGVLVEEQPQVVDAPVDLGHRERLLAVELREPGAQVLERSQLVSP